MSVVLRPTQALRLWQLVSLAEVTGGAQLFRVQAVGEQIRSLAVIGRDGRTVVEAPGGSRVRLDDVLLLPGEHYVRVQGGEGAYALRVMSLGPAPDGSTAVDAPGASDELRSAGVGIALNKYLKVGDVVNVTIDELASIEDTGRAEP